MRIGVIFPEQVFGLTAFSGGVQRRVYEISRRLAKRGHQVTFFSPSSKQITKFPLPNVTIELIPVKYLIQPQMNLSFTLKVLSMIKHCYNLDVVETHFDAGLGTLLSKSIHHLDFITVQVIHGLMADEALNIFKYERFSSPRSIPATLNLLLMGSIELLCSKSADVVVTVNRHAANLLSKLGISFAKISIIPNGVDTTKFSPNVNGSSLRRRILGMNEGYMILFVGRLGVRKGVRFLVQALYEIVKKKRTLNPKLVIIGDGPEGFRLKKLAQMLGLEHSIFFKRNIPENELPKYYAACDVFCLPSLQEAQSLSILEAQACGKPVVTTNTGGLPEVVIDNKTGILVPPAHPKQLATVLELLATDLSLREELGKAAANYAKKNSWENVTKLTETIYLHRLSNSHDV